MYRHFEEERHSTQEVGMPLHTRSERGGAITDEIETAIPTKAEECGRGSRESDSGSQRPPERRKLVLLCELRVHCGSDIGADEISYDGRRFFQTAHFGRYHAHE